MKQKKNLISLDTIATIFIAGLFLTLLYFVFISLTEPKDMTTDYNITFPNGSSYECESGEPRDNVFEDCWPGGRNFVTQEARYHEIKDTDKPNKTFRDYNG